MQCSHLSQGVCHLRHFDTALDATLSVFTITSSWK
jgi:hypothetical protein